MVDGDCKYINNFWKDCRRFSMKITKGETPEGKINTVTTEDLNSVKISRNSRGYNWEIKGYDKDISVLPGKINVVDDRLRELFGEKEKKNGKD